ncbi:MAG: cobyrinate a,c-diamide synthase [Atribacterota bacterium]
MTQGILLAGTHSGVGKTTVSIGLMGFLSKFHNVIPFKVGPDYIDPGYHQLVCRRKGYNLDLFLLGQERLEDLFRSRANSGEVAVVEGVMGLFDGLGAENLGSSAQIAKILSLPVVLVVDARGMSGSVAALVRGFRDFDPGVTIRGVFLNRVRNDNHLQRLRQSVERDTGLSVVGFLPDDPELILSERHLGLVPVREAGMRERVERIVEVFSRNADKESLWQMVGEVRTIPFQKQGNPKIVRVGYAYDDAFHFYYQSSLESLNEAGVELVPFSPLNDEHLPEGVSGLYLGGGFLEVFVSQLCANRRLKEAIWQLAIRGMPIYAECGGLMYLSQTLWVHGKVFPMVGVLNLHVEMTSRLQRFGYAQALTLRDNLLASKGMRFRGHEFHYSRTVDDGERTTYRIEKPQGGQSWQCGFMKKNVLATYLHIDFFAFSHVAQRFAQACRTFASRGMS